MPQLRQNIFTGEWVIVAPERSKRPTDFISASQPSPTHHETCPFCLDQEAYKHRLHGYETEHIYVMPNKFPAYVDVEKVSLRDPADRQLYTDLPAEGEHYVIVVKDHQYKLSTFPRDIWRDLFVIFRRVYRKCREDGQNSTMAIYNEQLAAGASIVHPHAQIFASKQVSELIAKETRETLGYYLRTRQSLFEKVIEHEKQIKRRVVAESEQYIAFTQFAAKYPFETWILPKFEQPHFEKTTDRQLAGLVSVTKTVMDKINRRLHAPAMNFYLHSAPHHFSEAPYYRWHLEIAPRLSTFGGYELGSETVIDVVSPELAADYLNEPA